MGGNGLALWGAWIAPWPTFPNTFTFRNDGEKKLQTLSEILDGWDEIQLL